MKIKFKCTGNTEGTVFGKGMFFILPAGFFRYFNFGKVKTIHVGIVFMYSELSFSVRNELKLTKQTQTKAG